MDRQFKLRTLSGRVILLATLAESHGSLESHLRAMGARVLRAPVARVTPPSSYASLDRALERFPSYDAVVFASRNAVESFFSRARAMGLRLKAPSRVFAVGPQTSRALRLKGWRARIPRSFHAEALADCLGDVKGWRILVPRAKKGRKVLASTLRKKGAHVDSITAYQIVPQRSPITLKTPCDLVVFTFGSAVDHFLSALDGPARRRLFSRAAIASLGPSTTAALRRRGLKPDIEAPQATMAALGRAIARWGNRREHGKA